ISCRQTWVICSPGRSWSKQSGTRRGSDLCGGDVLGCPSVNSSDAQTGQGAYRFRGITGYLFRSEDLRKYRPVRGMTVHPEGVVTSGEAAAVLGVTMPVVRGLVAQGILHTTAEYRNGLSK